MINWAEGRDDSCTKDKGKVLPLWRAIPEEQFDKHVSLKKSQGNGATVEGQDVGY